MKKRLLLSVFAAGLSFSSWMMLSRSEAAPATGAAASASTTAKPMSIYNFTLKSLDGKDVDLSRYKGKVVMIVNTASKCGNTPQYAGLERTYQKYSSQGLVILGFPANNFASQEPGTDAQIGEFCQKNYGVTFPMFSKISVKGADKAPLYKYLTEDANPELKGDIDWNFAKFIVARDGKVVTRFKAKVLPESPEVVKAVETELAKK